MQMETPRERGKLVVGDVVIYHDPTGKPFNALVTASWDGNLQGTINLLFVSDSESEQDSYGRQMKRESSVCHASKTTVHGRYWRFHDEPVREYVPPASA